MILNRWLMWANYSRIKYIRKFAWSFIEPKGDVFSPSESATRILVGGDISLDLKFRMLKGPLGVYFLKKEIVEYWLLTKTIRKFRRVMYRLLFSSKFFSDKVNNVSFDEILLKTPENKNREILHPYYRTCTRFNIDYGSIVSKFYYPFERTASFMKKRDLVLVNLETPLARNPRAQGFFISEPQYAQAMKDSGITIVNLANNHMFDAGETGFLQTVENLENAGISYTGAGENLDKARSGKIIELNSFKFNFLGYTQFCNNRFAFVDNEHPCILPLNTKLILEDIKMAKKKADFVFVSLHWGFENQPNVHPKQIEIAHLLIDEGADAIIGHHPHVPHGIEIYKKRPILYSLGNFIFGHYNNLWRSDNFLAEIVIDQRCIQGIIIYPISGKEKELFQPELVSGDRANRLLHELQIKSIVFDTGIAVQNNVGYIKI